MKKLKYCTIVIIVLLLWLVLSVIGFLGKDTIYKEYQINGKSTPYFVLVMQGVHDGIYPWSKESEPAWSQAGLQEESQEQPQKQQQESAWIQETQQPFTEETEQIPETETQIEEEVVQEKTFHEVDSSYFSDALFIGDSRTVGLCNYGGLEAEFYANVGMSVYKLWKEAFCEVDGALMTLEDALKVKQFGKIYIQLGINEAGTGTTESFCKVYQETLEKIRELQPDAIIFVQSIMKVGKEKSEKDPVFQNDKIQERNDAIAQLANGTDIFYLDINEVLCDEDGALMSSLSFDGVHLLGSKYSIWAEYLMLNGI